MTSLYSTPESLGDTSLSVPVAKAEDAIARLDERLRRHPLADGFNARLAYGEACATALAEGDLVHLEDIVVQLLVRLLQHSAQRDVVLSEYNGCGQGPARPCLSPTRTRRAALFCPPNAAR